jgi:hypothetical protein
MLDNILVSSFNIVSILLECNFIFHLNECWDVVLPFRANFICWCVDNNDHSGKNECTLSPEHNALLDQNASKEYISHGNNI